MDDPFKLGFEIVEKNPHAPRLRMVYVWVPLRALCEVSPHVFEAQIRRMRRKVIHRHRVRNNRKNG